MVATLNGKLINYGNNALGDVTIASGNSVTLSANTKFVVASAGVYNLQFSAQLESTGGGLAQTMDIWLAINGNNVDNNGYTRLGLMVDGVQKLFKLHRLLALTFIPNPNNYDCVDHINGDKADNRIDNLHWVNVQQNQHNQREAKGYSFHKKTGKWLANIRCDCKLKNLGYFDTEAEAREAYCKARLERNSGSGATTKDY
jgi:hypothetical protein